VNLSYLERQLAFLREIDRLKGVLRMSPLIDQSRRENSAEHSWHLAMYALVLSQYAAAPVNVERVVKMLLLHDIVEIDAGDTPFHHASMHAAQAEREQQAAQRIFALLPDAQAAEFRDLWCEFEAAQSADAIFAKALDRFQPLLHNVATDGGTWVAHQLNQEQVFSRYGPVIQRGAPALWDAAARLVQEHFAEPSHQKPAP
jgi:putative hydrolase of HD superfamily